MSNQESALYKDVDAAAIQDPNITGVLEQELIPKKQAGFPELRSWFNIDDYKENLRSFIGTLIGVGLIVFIQKDILSKNDHFFLIAPLGASAVLLYSASQSPFAQPRNLIGGHLISALIGVSIQQILPNLPLVAAPLAVALSILCMQITKTLHPPGGATALVAIIGSKKVKLLGYMFIVNPVLTGALVLLCVALVVNNFKSTKNYPTDARFNMFFKKVFFKKSIQ